MVAGVFLATAFVLFLSSGVTPETMSDPAKALAAASGAGWKLAMVAFALTAGTAVLFVAGWSARLRDKAPTRSAALLYLSVIGLAAHAAGAMVGWKGAGALTASMAQDPTAAAHAWVALSALVTTFDGMGNTFTGVGALLGGWAVLGTGAMPAAAGWVAVVAGVVALLTVVGPEAMLLPNIVVTVVFLIWVGSALRRG
jgi:hypothetical protein